MGHESETSTAVLERDMPRIQRVSAIILSRQGKILLSRRNSPEITEADGKWELPGGKVKKGESKTEAIKREVRQETGLEVGSGRRLPLTLDIPWKHERGTTEVEVDCFVFITEDENVKKLDSEVRELRWVTKAQFETPDIQDNLLPIVRPFTDMVFSKSR